ncbi:Protein of unknown function [Cotesia congregata]|uniref:Endonuclease/exonuclease/phosphatase domain-containing protein n=1 Tax=Cotesia congregata TaxID=51543 RepID=A0A8J2H6Z3_COTCN|nr:Protein of unknown function [Cotesia congregata]
MFWNVAGLRNKDKDFWEYLSEFELVGLMETWIEEKDWPEIKKKLNKGWRWEYIAATREKKRGRAREGMIMEIRKEIDNDEMARKKEGIIGMQLRIDGNIWNVLTVYNRKGDKALLEELDRWLKEKNEGNIIIGGDWNARTGRKGGIEGLNEGRMRWSEDKEVNKAGKNMLELLERKG